MPDNHFNRDEVASWYASRHLKTDPGIREVYYLPGGSPEREIRLLEVNDLVADRQEDPLEPIDFGVEIGGTNAHTLFVCDVTPAQWEQINKKQLRLPGNWSLDNAVRFPRN
jgi:hypothetical protein